MKKSQRHRYAFLSIPLRLRCPAGQKSPPPQPSPTRAGGSLNRASGHEIVAFPRNKKRRESLPTKRQIKAGFSSAQAHGSGGPTASVAIQLDVEPCLPLRY